ncbi:probable G-protein coupled receptor AH9.1 [Lineus longissimus]|uniref:probable G-protein coupled receptor AH9.1 n=1 Tax=Lineus longissimus TaxID=88925 RepID=UPI00315DF570
MMPGSFKNATEISNHHQVDSYLEGLEYAVTMLVRIGPPIVIFIGVVGNALSLLVLCGRHYSTASTTWFMKIIAIFDIIGCSVVVGIRWIATHYPSIAIEMGDAYCKGYFFGAHWLINASAWTLVCMTVDRAISVCKPLQASQICTVARARKTVLGLSVCFAFLAAPCFTRNFRIQEGAIFRAQCPFTPAWMYDAFYVTTVVVRLWTAPIVVLLCNIIIVIALFRRRKQRAELSQENAKSRKKESQLNAMLILVSWVFILCYFPVTFDILFWTVFRPAPWTPIEAAIRKITNEVGDTMMFVNHAVNFYLYILGVKRFREDFIKLFRCSFIKKRPHISDETQ